MSRYIDADEFLENEDEEEYEQEIRDLRKGEE